LTTTNGETRPQIGSVFHRGCAIHLDIPLLTTMVLKCHSLEVTSSRATFTPRPNIYFKAICSDRLKIPLATTFTGACGTRFRNNSPSRTKCHSETLNQSWCMSAILPFSTNALAVSCDTVDRTRDEVRNQFFGSRDRTIERY